MRKIERILVALDMSNIDKTLVKFTSFISRSTDAKKITFINVLKNINVPEEVVKEFPDIIKNAIEERKENIQKRVAKFLKTGPEVELDYVVTSSTSAMKSIIKETDKRDIDLIVVGRKRTSKGSGVLTNRLARRADVNLLIVPEGSENKLDSEHTPKKILVPVDFSDFSQLAMEHAIDIATHFTVPVEIVCQHVYDVPVGYHYTGKSRSEFAKIMKHNSEKDYKTFMKHIDTRGIKVIPVYSYDTNDDLVEDIYEQAVMIKADGIVFGAKGRTATSALFLGSIAEKMIKIDTEFPLLVVRRKGDAAGFMDFIREI